METGLGQRSYSDGTVAAGLFANIAGERVALGPLRRELIPLYQRRNNDFGTPRTLRPSGPITAEVSAADYARLDVDERAVAFAAYERATWRPIGTTGRHDIDWRNRTAEYVLSIGESDCRGRGYGTEVTRLLLDYAFTTLGLRSVMLRVYADNLAGLRAYQKAGFREFGRRRQCQRMGQTLWEAISMDCPASEFVSPVLGAIFAPDEPRRQGGADE